MVNFRHADGSQSTSTQQEFSLLKAFNIPDQNPTAVKTLFDYLEGYTTMMDSCDSFSILGNMLAICDFYIINGPIRMIKEKIRELELSVHNLVEAYQAAKKLESLDRFKVDAKNLVGRSLAYGSVNLAAWQCLISFVVDNGEKLEEVVNILQHFGQQDRQCSIRYGKLS